MDESTEERVVARGRARGGGRERETVLEDGESDGGGGDDGAVAYAYIVVVFIARMLALSRVKSRRLSRLPQLAARGDDDARTVERVAGEVAAIVVRRDGGDLLQRFVRQKRGVRGDEDLR